MIHPAGTSLDQGFRVSPPHPNPFGGAGLLPIVTCVTAMRRSVSGLVAALVAAAAISPAPAQPDRAELEEAMTRGQPHCGCTRARLDNRRSGGAGAAGTVRILAPCGPDRDGATRKPAGLRVQLAAVAAPVQRSELRHPGVEPPDPLTNTRTGIAIEQRVFDAGSTLLAVQAAKLDRDLAAASQDGASSDLAFRAAQAFVRVLQLEAAVRATDAAVAASDSDRQRARARRETGLATDADVLAVEVHRADMHQRQITAAGDLAVARIQLADAVGLPLTAPLMTVRPAARPIPADEDTLVRDALTNHPLRRQAGLREELADNTRRSARAAWLPTVAAQAGWEFNGATLGTQQSSWMVGAEVRLNLFRGFGDAARLEEAGTRTLAPPRSASGWSGASKSTFVRRSRS